MNSYQVNVEEIKVATAGIKNSTANIQSEVQKLTSGLTNLQNTWKGGASAQFQSIVTQWNSAQKNVEQALESINRALNLAGQTYADAENQASMLFSK